MTSAFKAVQDALVTALKANPTIVGTRVVAGRARPMPEEHSTDIAVSIERVQGSDNVISGAPKRWDVTYAVVIRARGSSTVDAVAATDPLLESVWDRLDDIAPPVGVNGWALEPSIRFQVDEGSTPIGVVTLALNVQLSTQAGSLTLAT
jgi:hypothetical protein